MPVRKIVVGQKVSATTAQAARDLRRNMTDEVRTLWQALRTNKLHGLHFRRQQVIEGFVVDFYCHAADLVVEVDSPSHRHQAEYDRERDHALARRGLRVLRVTNEDVRRDLARVLERIASETLRQT